MFPGMPMRTTKRAGAAPRARLAPSRAFSAVLTMVPYTHSSTSPILWGSSSGPTYSPYNWIGSEFTCDGWKMVPYTHSSTGPILWRPSPGPTCSQIIAVTAEAAQKKIPPPLPLLEAATVKKLPPPLPPVERRYGAAETVSIVQRFKGCRAYPILTQHSQMTKSRQLRLKPLQQAQLCRPILHPAPPTSMHMQ